MRTQVWRGNPSDNSSVSEFDRNNTGDWPLTKGGCMLVLNDCLPDGILGQVDRLIQADWSVRCPAVRRPRRSEGSGLMSDDLAGTVCLALREFEDQYGRLSNGRPRALDELVRLVRETVKDPGLDGVAQEDLAVVVALGWLGPPCAGVPPAPMRDQLAQVIRH